jgi:hypothetical protein
MLTNICDPSQEGNFLDEQGNVIKPENVEDCNCHMRYVDKDDRMANSTQLAVGYGSGQKRCFSICSIWLF